MMERDRTRGPGRNGQEEMNRGRVTAVRGNVVDVRFPEQLPDLYNELVAGDDNQIMLEVLSHLDDERVRSIALTDTQGLAREATVLDRGRPLQVPIGNALLGRMFNVFGETIDRKKAVNTEKKRSVHQEPVPISQRRTETDIFTTGIKAIDVLTPLERGGKAGLYGGAGVGKTALARLESNFIQRFIEVTE